MKDSTMKAETVIEAMKGAPAVAGAVASSITLNQWVAIGTGIYIVIQALYLLRKWYREEKDWAGGKRKRAPR